MDKVVVGLSGGMDSAVAACLLKEQGYDVTGMTMLTGADQETAVKDAAAVADLIGIPYVTVEVRSTFERQVIDDFTRRYEEGKTPNPCVICNRLVKWKALMDTASEIGAQFVATGHYAKVVALENGRYTLSRSTYQKKDQSYALYRLTQEQLKHTLMPNGEYPKDQVRKKADAMGLPVANKPDSQDICFIPDGDYASFIEKRTGKVLPEGNFVSPSGQVLGRHKGITHYTVGQRKGLGLALGEPAYVLKIRPESNEVVVGDLEESQSKTLKATHLNWMAIEELTEPKRVSVKIRYHHPGAYAWLTPIGEDEVLCTFDEPQKAITPGQSAVFYEDDLIVGGGMIE